MAEAPFDIDAHLACVVTVRTWSDRSIAFTRIARGIAPRQDTG
jgi:hypothetical protein